VYQHKASPYVFDISSTPELEFTLLSCRRGHGRKDLVHVF
jgi:hypothetical protein